MTGTDCYCFSYSVINIKKDNKNVLNKVLKALKVSVINNTGVHDKGLL